MGEKPGGRFTQHRLCCRIDHIERIAPLAAHQSHLGAGGKHRQSLLTRTRPPS